MKRSMDSWRERKRSWRLAALSSIGGSGFAALQCGKASPFRGDQTGVRGYASTEAQPPCYSRVFHGKAEPYRNGVRQSRNPTLLRPPIAKHVRQHPIRARQAATQLAVPNHAGVDVMPTAVIRDEQSALERRLARII